MSQAPIKVDEAQVTRATANQLNPSSSEPSSGRRAHSQTMPSCNLIAPRCDDSLRRHVP